MRTSPRVIVSLFIILLFGSIILPFAPTFDNTTLNEILSFDENTGGDDWGKLNDAQKKAMVDWERNTTSENFFLKQIGGQTDEHVGGIALGDSGSVYISGDFENTLEIGDIVLTSNGKMDAFVAKLDARGNWIWALSFGGYEFDRGEQVAVDSNENVYVTGRFGSEVTFAPGYTLTPEGGMDIYVIKIDSQGNPIWAATAGGSFNDYSTEITVTEGDSIYVSGYFYSTHMNFTSNMQLNNISLINAGYATNYARSDIFIAKISSSGTWASTANISGIFNDIPTSLTHDSNGNIYIAGYWDSVSYTPLYFSNSSGYTTDSLVGLGGFEIFIAKLVDNGSHLEWEWVQSAGGEDTDQPNSIALDSKGNIYVTGNFKKYAVFGNNAIFGDVWNITYPDPADTTNYYWSYSQDIFIAKLSSNGTWLWSTSAGVGGSWGIREFRESGTGIAVDSNDDIFVSGFFQDTVSNFGNNVLTSNGANDIFITKLDANGNWIWATSVGGPNDDAQNCNCLVIDKDGGVLIAGDFEQSFGLGVSTETDLVSYGDNDIFVLNINIENSPSFSFSDALAIGSTGSENFDSITIDSLDNVYVTGSFEGIINFGLNTLVSNGDSDVFVAKLNGDGFWEWAVNGGGVEHDEGSEITTGFNSTGHPRLYVTGHFRGTASFGSNIVTSNGSSLYSDVFVAELDTQGIWQWVSSAGGPENDDGKSLDFVQYHSGIIVTGHFRGTANFDGFNVTSNGLSDIFVAMLDQNGNWEWVVSIGSSDYDYIRSISAVCSGDCTIVNPTQYKGDGSITAAFSIYLTGRFTDTIQIGDDVLTSAGGYDLYLAKISNEGEWVWANGIGGSDTEYGGAVDATISGAYVTGSFSSLNSSFGFDSKGDEVYSTSTSGIEHAFVAKYYSSGNVAWLEVPETTSAWAEAIGIHVNYDYENPEIYVTGYYTGSIDFSNLNGPGNETVLQAVDSTDVYTYKIIENQWKDIRNLEWVLGIHGQGSEYSTDIAINTNEDVFTVGNYYIDISIGLDTLTSYGSSDSFISIATSDFDGDSFADKNDAFPFEASQNADTDGDMFGDNPNGFNGDSCPQIYGSSWLDRWGCPDMDEDGQSDLGDAFMQQPTQWIDTDGDGLGDNWDGVTVKRNGSTNGIGEYWPNAYKPDPYPLDFDNDGFDDADLISSGAIEPFDDCPLIYGTSTEDSSGCVDSDGDGWSDVADSHSGDSTQWNDTDSDGYGDNSDGNQPDFCPDEYGESWEDVFGCTDLDGDGFSNYTDFDDGNPLEIKDSDGDGIGDNSDQCPYLWGNMETGSEMGCLDTDGDGIADDSDLFINDPTQWSDVDGDGYGDNIKGTLPDTCPLESGNSELGGYGCPDTDKDGYGNNVDKFPVDSTQWNDTDGDGYGDSDLGRNPDYCPEENGTSSKGGTLGCLDSDGDGWADIIDLYPTETNLWSDSDGDGFSDQLGHPTISDDCPGQIGDSTEMMRGCPDMDDDGIPDIYDDDTDGDGISNSIERQAGYDPYDSQNTPVDFDGDGIPDALDDDDDDDGFPDDFENERGSDSKNPTSTPLSMYGNQESGIFYVPGQGFSSSYQEDGYELSMSWLLTLISSEFLIPIILLPLSILLLMGKKRRFKKFKKRMNKIDDIEDLEDLEEDIDAMIEKGSVKVEHAMLLRNQFERRREKLSGKSHMDRLFKNSRSSPTVDYQPEERLGGPPIRGPPGRGGPPRRGPPGRR
mgnify:CR=1 FL=1